MSFKAALRCYLFSVSGVVAELGQEGTLVGAHSGAVTTITVAGLTTAPGQTGQLLLKDSSGNYEMVNFTASADAGGGNYAFTVSVTLVNSYANSDYVAVEVDAYSFGAPQNANMPYVVIHRLSTDEIYNYLDAAGTIVVESWQISCFASTDDACELVKDAIVDALNLVNPTTWSDDGFATSYQVLTSYLESTVDIEDFEEDGSQNYTIHKPCTFKIKRARTAA